MLERACGFKSRLAHTTGKAIGFERTGRLFQLRDRDVALGPQDVFVVPAGVEHCPRADEPVTALLIEPRGTVNTGDAGGERTTQVREL